MPAMIGKPQARTRLRPSLRVRPEPAAVGGVWCVCEFTDNHHRAGGHDVGPGDRRRRQRSGDHVGALDRGPGCQDGGGAPQATQAFGGKAGGPSGRGVSAAVRGRAGLTRWAAVP